MGDLREQMRRARGEAPPPDEAMTRLQQLRERRTRNGRVLSAAIALAVTGALVVAGVSVLNHRGPATGPGASGPKGATKPATSGQGGTSGPSAGGQGGTSGPVSSGPTGPSKGGKAAGVPNLVAGPGQFYYWKFAIVAGGAPSTMTEWWSPQGTGRMVTAQGGGSYGVPPSGPLQMGEGMIGDDLSGLSTDPSQLLQQLVQRSSDEGASPRPDVTPGPGQTAETGRLVSAVEDLLSERAPHASPELRVALFGVLVKEIPTVQNLGNLPDPTGRPAIALRVTLDASPSQLTFWFDPNTLLFLAEEATDPAPTPAGTSAGTPATSGPGETSTTYLIVQSAGIVDSDQAAPTDDQRIVPEAGPLPTP